jgi:20S proteasome alpha/beta subunit
MRCCAAHLTGRSPQAALCSPILCCAVPRGSFGPYFCSPVIAGLESDGTPYLAGMDTIGALETAKDFMVAGTAPDSLYGMCESMFKPDMVRRRSGKSIDRPQEASGRGAWRRAAGGR